MEPQTVVVHERVPRRHPDLTSRDVLEAWRNRVCCQVRMGPWPPQYVAVGFDQRGRPIEMVAVYDPAQDEVLVFHAQTPVSEKVQRELGIDER